VGHTLVVYIAVIGAGGIQEICKGHDVKSISSNSHARFKTEYARIDVEDNNPKLYILMLLATISGNVRSVMEYVSELTIMSVNLIHRQPQGISPYSKCLPTNKSRVVDRMWAEY
jgi:hypothetical protein